MTDLFNHISKLVPSLPGWAPVDKACTLAGMVLALRPNVVVEIGVFGGRSFFPMALACKAVDHGLCIGIDPWRAVASAEGQTGPDLKYWSECDHDKVMQDFLKTGGRLDISKYVRILRKTSDQAEVPPEIDLFHCDGNHGPQAVKDIQRWAPAVRIGGIAVLDDITWRGGAVGEAVKVLLGIGFSQLYRVTNTEGDWATFQRMKG